MKPTRQQILPLLLFGPVVAVSLGYFAWGGSAEQPPRDTPGKNYCAFDSGVWFNVEKPLDWPALKGRPVLLEFWASWCASCLKQIPRFNGLQRRYADRGLIVIGVSKEAAPKAYAYSRQYNIEYAVCAEQEFHGIDALPTTLLLDGRGNVIYKAVGELQTAALRLKLEDLPVLSARGLLRKGAMHGYVNDRPEFARGYDEAAFKVEIEDFLARLEAGQAQDIPSEVERLFGYYHRNLPSENWSGDDGCRDALVSSILYLRDRFRHHGRQEGIGQLRRELPRLLMQHDPDWVLRSSLATIAGKTLAKSPATIELLEEWCEVEKNPVIKFHLTRSLEWLDESRTPYVPPDSAFERAQADYAFARQNWKNRVFGLPKDLAEYENYVKDTESAFESKSPAELIARFRRDYDRHRGRGRRDVLVRYYILENARALGATRPMAPEEKCRLEKWLFSVFKGDEPDWAIRRKGWLSFWRDGFHCLDKSEVLPILEDRIRDEEVRDVRAYLEFGRMEMLGIEH